MEIGDLVTHAVLGHHGIIIDIDLEIEETQEKNELHDLDIRWQAIQPMRVETDTEFHDLNIKEMEAEDPEKHVFTPVEEEFEPNIIHVLEERLEEL